MRKELFVFLVSCFFFLEPFSKFSMAVGTLENLSPFVDWGQRPVALKQFIDERFRFVVRRLNDWGIYPGNDTNRADYCIMGVPDPLVIEAMIRKAPSQKTWILGLGMARGAGLSRAI